MQTKATFVAALILPLLLLACDRAEQSPTAAAPGQEKQAMTPSSPDKTLESAPPAAGTLGGPSSTEPAATPVPQPTVPSPDNAAPATPQNDAKKTY